MRRYVAIAATVSLFLLGTFALVELLGIGLLTDPSDTLAAGGLGVALIAVGLLVADVVLPVPSSVVMVALGAAYGLAAGAILGTIGSVLAATLSFTIGRRAQGPLNRIVSESDRAAFASWFAARGDLAIILSRPLPIAAETVAGLAGATTMPARRFVPVVVVGTLPVAVAYSAAGAAVAESDSGLVVAASVVAVAGAFWFAAAGWRRRVGPTAAASDTVA